MFSRFVATLELSDTFELSSIQVLKVGTLDRLILALVKFCDFEVFRFSVYFNLANSWKISKLEKMVFDMVFNECDSACLRLKRVTICIKILYLVNP